MSKKKKSIWYENGEPTGLNHTVALFTGIIMFAFFVGVAIKLVIELCQHIKIV